MVLTWISDILNIISHTICQVDDILFTIYNNDIFMSIDTELNTWGKSNLIILNITLITSLSKSQDCLLSEASRYRSDMWGVKIY